MILSTAQREQLRSLLDERERLRREVQTLANLTDAAKRVAETHEQARQRRLMLIGNPSLCEGLIELLRRTDPDTAALIPRRYHDLLHYLHPAQNSPLPPLDYATLSPGARPYLLGPYLNLSFGAAYPALSLTQSDPAAGRLVYMSTNGPSDSAVWQRHLPAISDWLNGPFEIIHHSVSTIVLQRREPLAATIPFQRSWLAHSQLYLGIDTSTRRHVHMPFADMTSGTFVVGASGTGKSKSLHLLLQSIFTNLALFDAVYLVDGKDGVAFNRYTTIAPGKVKVLWEEADLWRLTTDLVATMRARNAAQREAGIDNATGNFIAVVIDEMATYTAKPSGDPKHPDMKAHARFLDELAMLARRGRSTGLRMIITAQEPTVDQIPATVRANCLTTVAFRMPIDAHATSVFGQLEGLPADPRKLTRGQALIRNGLTGTLQHVQFPLLA